MAGSFLLSALVASKRHPVHSPTTTNCNCFVAAGCISCILRTQHLLLITLCTKHTLAPTSHLFSVRPGLYRAQTSLRHTGHPQVTAVIYGLLEQTSPTQGDMEQERGHSPIFLLRIWWHCSFYSVPLHNSQMWLSAMAIPSSRDHQLPHHIIQHVVPLCWKNNHSVLELEISDSCQYFLCSHVELSFIHRSLQRNY